MCLDVGGLDSHCGRDIYICKHCVFRSIEVPQPIFQLYASKLVRMWGGTCQNQAIVLCEPPLKPGPVYNLGPQQIFSPIVSHDAAQRQWETCGTFSSLQPIHTLAYSISSASDIFNVRSEIHRQPYSFFVHVEIVGLTLYVCKMRLTAATGCNCKRTASIVEEEEVQALTLSTSFLLSAVKEVTVLSKEAFVFLLQILLQLMLMSNHILELLKSARCAYMFLSAKFKTKAQCTAMITKQKCRK